MNSHQELFGGNIPQDVTGKQGENAIFIVYGLKQSDNTIKQVKDLCANFSALIRSMRNRFPEMQFSCTIGFGADAWKQLFPEQGNPKELKTLKQLKELNILRFQPPVIFFYTSGQNRWDSALSLPPLSTKS